MTDPAFRFWRLPGKDPQATRALVRRVARIYGGHPVMRWFVMRRVLAPAHVAPRDELGMAAAIHAWVRDHVAFVNESGEQVLTPGRTLRWRFGDCDDRSCLVAAMLESVRIPWRLVLLSKRVGRELVPFHIWPQARIRGRWIDLETSHSRAQFAEHPVTLMKRLAGLSL
jgi:transglutaminase-like putative cysteine protease